MSEEYVVPIPDLLAHQHESAYHPARFKLLCKGRRSGKDIEAFNVSWFGHGPDRKWPGIVDGWDVAWLAPDYPQAKSVWLQEIQPRFEGIPGVNLNETEHRVTIEGHGSLVLRSAENVTSLRGLGKRLIGVVVNEAAHLDLADAWRRVIRPILMDNKGWAYIMSTPNRGADGGVDEEGIRRVPSYFNTLCEEVRAGKRGTDWAVWFGDARENPKIPADEFQALLAEYPEGSVAMQEEVYALLLPPGTGLAFSEWRDDVHVLDTFTVPRHWRYAGGYDWGYWSPSAFILFAQGDDGATVAVAEKKWTQKLAFEMGQDIARMCQAVAPMPVEYIAADSSMWGVQAQKGFPNIAEELQAGINAEWDRAREAGWKGPLRAPMLVAIAKGHDSRIAGATLFHRYLKWTAEKDGTILPFNLPRLRFTKACPYLVASIPRLPPSPTDNEDVDTDADDHGYDAARYYLMSRPPLPEAPRAAKSADDHPGLTERYPGLVEGTKREPVGLNKYTPSKVRTEAGW